MKTMKQVINDGYMPAKLVRGVILQLGSGKKAMDSLEDVYNHGADGGFNGFIYYCDTLEFYRRYKKEIIQLAEQMSDDLGMDTIEMIMNFGCFKDNEHDPQFKREIMKTLYGQAVNTEVANAMAWFALEEVAREFCD